MDLCGIPQVMPVLLVMSPQTPPPLGSYLVEMLPEFGLIALEGYLICNGRQEAPVVGCGVLQPSEILGISSAPLIRTTLDIYDCELPEDAPTYMNKLIPFSDGPSGRFVGSVSIASPRPRAPVIGAVE